MKISRALLYLTFSILGVTGILAGLGYLFIMGSIIVYSVLPILLFIILYAMVRVTMRYRAELLGKAYLLSTVLLFVISIGVPSYFLYRFPENDGLYLAEGGQYKEKNGDQIKFEIYNFRNHQMAYKRYWKLDSIGNWQKYGSWEFYNPSGKMTIYEEYDTKGKLKFFPKKEEKK
jgi:hypothetical protein